MVIQPEVIVTPDSPTVRFRDPEEKVDLDKEIPKILVAQGWGVGTYFNVQFLSHDKQELLASRPYVVTSAKEGLRTTETNPYQPVTSMAYTRTAEPVGPWWRCAEAPQETDIGGGTSNEPAAGSPDEPDITVKWNPGKKVHEVKVGDNVVFEHKEKQVATEYADGLTAAA